MPKAGGVDTREMEMGLPRLATRGLYLLRVVPNCHCDTKYRYLHCIYQPFGHPIFFFIIPLKFIRFLCRDLTFCTNKQISQARV